MRTILGILALGLGLLAQAQSLVLLSTNDTHSSIDPDASGRGGILDRKAIVDSVRQVEPNVLLIDAGDMVQGSLYFKLFAGDVEYPLNNMMGYDIRILGNHEFDNGLQDLARFWRGVKADRLSANYDFSDTPARGIFKPWAIKKVGNRKVGFIGINVDPESLILEENYRGMKFSDPIETANETAALLRKKGCDLVVAVTHIGYNEPLDKPDDIKMAKASRDIDIIIGGHSHTDIDPRKPEQHPHWIKNSEGRDVLVTQTGKSGRKIGYVILDLSDFSDRKMDYRQIPVTNRFTETSAEMKEHLQPYRMAVDSLNRTPVGWSLMEMANGSQTGAYPNWTGDFAVATARAKRDSMLKAGAEIPEIELGIMNVGGIRQPMHEGMISEGQVMATFPFSNRLRIITMKGSDLIETMRIAAAKGGESVSGEVRVLTDHEGNFLRMSVGGGDVDPEREYTLVTIDYLAAGNDDMVPMKRHREIWRDDQEVYVRVIEYLRDLTQRGLSVSTDPAPRFVMDAKARF